jgi:hypothetical protein
MEKRDIEIVAICKTCQAVITDDFPRGVKNAPARIQHECSDDAGFSDECYSEIPGVFVTEGAKVPETAPVSIDNPPKS